MRIAIAVVVVVLGLAGCAGEDPQHAELEPLSGGSGGDISGGVSGPRPRMIEEPLQPTDLPLRPGMSITMEELYEVLERPRTPTSNVCEAYLDVAFRDRIRSAELLAILDELEAGVMFADGADARLVGLGDRMRQEWPMLEAGLFDDLAAAAPDHLSADVEVLRESADRFVAVLTSVASMAEFHERLDARFPPAAIQRRDAARARIEDHVLAECGDRWLDLVR
jgi:hypothetical protein